jgi:AcrR family transcriptional regulator
MVEPRFQRRKEARPGEICAAALEVFVERGFAAAKLEEIARRAGVSKAAVYLYFADKETLFRAVVEQAVTPNVGAVVAMADAYEGPFAPLLEQVLERIAQFMTSSRIPAVAKMVIAESRNFPELARIWHERVVGLGVRALSGQIAKAQARGELKSGDPRFMAFSIMGPMLIGVIWRETFEPIGAEAIDVPALARQHARTVLNGMLARPEDEA